MTPSSEPFDPYYHWLGIPPEEQPPNHYRLLGIQPLEENREVIQNAADRQMAHLRTFQSGPRAAASQKILNEVSAARICLLSPEKKAAYDQQLRNATAPVSTLPARPPAVTPPNASPPTAGAHPAENGLHEKVAGGSSTYFADESAVTPMVNSVVKRRRSRLPLFVALTACGTLVTVIAAAVALYVIGWPRVESRLVLNWPASERAEASLSIDGRQIDLSTEGTVTDHAIELELATGPHDYRITRPQSQSLEGRFVLRSDERLELEIAFTPIPLSKTPRAGELIFIWPEADRPGQVLEIDGKPYDLTESQVKVDGSQIRVTVAPGLHQVALTSNGKNLLEWTLDAGSGKPVALTNMGTIELRWRSANRNGFTLLLDGAIVDLKGPGIRDNGTELEWEVPVGRRTLEFKQGDISLLTRDLVVTAGKRIPINIDLATTRRLSRLLLQWPVAEREGAILEVDGERQAIPTGPSAKSTIVEIKVEPGDHTITITRPGYDLFERTVPIGKGAFSFRVDATRVVASTIDEEQLRQLRAAYVEVYTQYSEFRVWSEETDPAKKQIALTALLGKMSIAASGMERASPEQFVAYDQAYRMAVEQHELKTAEGILQRLRAYRCISAEEQLKRQQELWDRAVTAADFDSALAYFRSAGVADKKLSAEEQQILATRISASPEIQNDFPAIERSVDLLESEQLLSPAVVKQLRATMLLSVAKVLPPAPDSQIALAEKMLDVVPGLLRLETDEALLSADSLVDAANGIRRKVTADRRNLATLRAELEELNASAKEMQDQVAQYRRVVEARLAIATDQGTGAQQKLLGFWLLLQSRYDEALPYLRQSGDASLAAMAKPLPTTASELSELADVIESESKKTKYLKQYELALLAYANHVRQLALSLDNTPMDADARDHANAVSGNLAGQQAWARMPRGKWQRLIDIVTLDTLRENAARPVEGTWSVLDDGTLVSTTLAPSRLALPIKPEGSYAFRCVCNLTDGNGINFNVPLGDRAVVFTLVASGGRYSGLQMIDGKTVDSPENVTAIDRTKLRFRRALPTQVEIHVELLPVDTQSSKQRKITGGKDWAKIGILINGKSIGDVSAASERFSVSPIFALPQGTIGFSAGSAATYGSIELMRK